MGLTESFPDEKVVGNQVFFESYNFNFETKESRDSIVKFLILFQRRHNAKIEKFFVWNISGYKYKLNIIKIVPNFVIVRDPTSITTTPLGNDSIVIYNGCWYLNY